MTTPTLDEREFELINIIGAKLGSNQRDLSRHLALSLGQTNMLIRRLVSKGFIRISQLNKKKVEYILTPKGFAEKMRKSVKYTLNTINSIGLIRKRLKEILSQLTRDGHRMFYIYGKSDLALLVDDMLKQIALPEIRWQRTEEVSQKGTDGMVLICREDFLNEWSDLDYCVNLVEELAKANGFIYDKTY